MGNKIIDQNYPRTSQEIDVLILEILAGAKHGILFSPLQFRTFTSAEVLRKHLLALEEKGMVKITPGRRKKLVEITFQGRWYLQKLGKGKKTKFGSIGIMLEAFIRDITKKIMRALKALLTKTPTKRFFIY